ncbi:hypothetical protein BT67DRAFT_381053 [Trichocladium antarcticum]|uniref:Uncharacterized protein n=1 Tax=Trichocladium antarcticum TaxID=1450529 RepID=A0AAN6UKF3_9PEZI|nr:hypothetical protein BT67DRAFT_381053 [Trichocladium antarcticum]
MAIRQLQPQSTRGRPDEIPESGEDDGHGDWSGGDGGDDNDDDHNNGTDNDENSIASDAPLSRPRSISSTDRNSSPPAASQDLAHPSHPTLRALPITRTTPPQSTPHRPASPYSTIPPTPTTPHDRDHHRASPRKRSRSRSPSPPPSRTPSDSSPHSSPPHAATTTATNHPRPFKRLKQPSFNPSYLALLNDDIRDAAERYTAPDPGGDGGDDAVAPAASQLGLTRWSAVEKMLFFEALGRLGADDAAGIARRVRTKGVLEVGAFLAVLRRAGTGGTAAAVWEVPAAVEVGQACCAALEEAADAVSVRQELYEEGVDMARWGEGGWLVGVGNLADVEREARKTAAEEGEGRGGMRSVRLFRVRSWLRLAERVFMNAAVDEYNWMSVAEERPAVRATALEDFHAIAVSVTRRLVAATIHVAESRVRARRVIYPGTRSRVWRQDVEAAALSLGLPTNSRRFWARCARRLRLNVHDAEGEDGGDVSGWDGAEDEKEPMAYDEVERALGLDSEMTDGGPWPHEDDEDDEDDAPSSEENDDDLASAPESDTGPVDLGAGVPYASEHEEALGVEDEAEKDAIDREVNELLVHSALEYPKTRNARVILRNRIRAARTHEAYAAALDARASYCEEKRLWAMLDRQPPMELAKVGSPEEPPRCTKRTVDDLIRSSSRTPGGGDWRSKLEAVPSRWEMEFALVEEKQQEQKRRR